MPKDTELLDLDEEGAEYALYHAFHHAFMGLVESHVELTELGGLIDEPTVENIHEVAEVIEDHWERSEAAFDAYIRRSGGTVEDEHAADAEWDVPLSRDDAIADLIRSAGGTPPNGQEEENNGSE